METKNNSHSLTHRPIGKGVLLFVLLITFLAPTAATRLHAAPPESFLLFYSNNIQGEIEPCG
jgi:hypothetical protein